MNMQLFNLGKLLSYLKMDTIILITAIIIIMVMTLTIAFRKDKYNWRKNAPSLITTSGIFCTFVGVSIGLTRFDPANSNSLNSLIEGLKLAFIPSTIAILIAIIFKWMSITAYPQNSSAIFLENLDKNTIAIDKLAEAILVVDWQIAYKQNLETNIEKNSELLALLENSLTELITVLTGKSAKVLEITDTLQQTMSNTSDILDEVNGGLQATLEQFNMKLKQSSTNLDQEHQRIGNHLQHIYQQLDNFKQIIQVLGASSSELTNQLKQVVTNHVRHLEATVSTELKRIVASHSNH